MKPGNPALILRCHGSRSRGSVLLYALVVVAIVGLLLTGWIQLLIVRGQYVETLVEATKRRLALSNSESLCKEYLFRNVFFSESGPAATVTLANGWGAFTLNAWNDNPLTSVNPPTGINHFNPGAGGGYSYSLNATITGSGITETRNLFIRSRSPIYGGYLMALQNPEPSTMEASGLSSMGGAFLWRPNSPNLYNLTAQRYQTPTVSQPSIVMRDSADNVIRMNNRALPALATSDFAGGLDIIDNAILGESSLVVKIATYAHFVVDANLEIDTELLESDGAGTVIVNLNSLDLMNLFIPGEVHTLILRGQSNGTEFSEADNLPSMMILLVQGQTSSRELLTVQFEGSNNRRLFLGLKKFSGAGVIWDASSVTGSWRLTTTLENCPVTVQGAPSQMTLFGGIRTVSSFVAGSPGMRIDPDPDPKLLERYADRQAWVEVYMP